MKKAYETLIGQGCRFYVCHRRRRYASGESVRDYQFDSRDEGWSNRIWRNPCATFWIPQHYSTTAAATTEARSSIFDFPCCIPHESHGPVLCAFDTVRDCDDHESDIISAIKRSSSSAASPSCLSTISTFYFFHELQVFLRVTPLAFIRLYCSSVMLAPIRRKLLSFLAC